MVDHFLSILYEIFYSQISHQSPDLFNGQFQPSCSTVEKLSLKLSEWGIDVYVT